MQGVGPRATAAHNTAGPTDLRELVRPRIALHAAAIQSPGVMHPRPGAAVQAARTEQPWSRGRLPPVQPRIAEAAAGGGTRTPIVGGRSHPWAALLALRLPHPGKQGTNTGQRCHVSRAIISLQVFLLMCAPLPQASYIGVAVGRDAGLALGIMLVLYTLSDLLALLLIAALVRRVRLPGRLGRWVARTAARAEGLAGGRTALPALFATGYASLYAVGVLAGLSRLRPARVIAAGLAGDLVQFTSTVALGGVLAHALPLPGGTWALLLAASLLTGAVALSGAAYKFIARALRPTVVPATTGPC